MVPNAAAFVKGSHDAPVDDSCRAVALPRIDDRTPRRAVRQPRVRARDTWLRHRPAVGTARTGGSGTARERQTCDDRHMTWTSPVPALVDGPMTGDDRPILEGMLSHQRATLLAICAGLTAEQLAERPLPSSNLSLLGLVRHLAKVERIWLRKRVAGEDVEHLHNFEARDDTDFDQLDPADAPDAVEQLRDEWALADRAVADIDFDHTIDHHGEMSLRMVYVHLVQEYARHNGHADLLREAIDGVTGR